MIYLIVPIIVFALYYLSYYYEKKCANDTSQGQGIKILKYPYLKYAYVLAMIILVLLAGLRDYNVGYDTPAYKKNYDIMLQDKSFKSGYGYEFLFQLINYLGVILFKNELGFTFVLIVSELIIVLCVNKAIRKVSPNIPLTMFLFTSLDVYYRGFGQIRQQIAIAFLILASTYIYEKKLFKYLVCCLVAFLFHKSAIIFVPIYFLFMFKNQYISYALVILAGLIFTVFNVQVIKLLDIIFKFGYYDRYISTNYGILKLTTVGWLEVAFSTLVCITVFVFKIIYKKELNKNSKRMDLYFLIFLVSVVLYYISAILQRPALYGRLIYIFFWSLIFLTTCFCHNIKKLVNPKFAKVIYILVIIVSIGYVLLGTYGINAYGIMPYKTILF